MTQASEVTVTREQAIRLLERIGLGTISEDRIADAQAAIAEEIAARVPGKELPGWWLSPSGLEKAEAHNALRADVLRGSK